MKTVVIVVGFILIMTIALLITCMISFGAQFNKWETKIEIEYRGLQPFLYKRQQLLQQLFLAFQKSSMNISSIKESMDEISNCIATIKDEKDWKIIIEQNASMINQLSNLYTWIKEQSESFNSECKDIVEQLNHIEEDIIEHSEAYNKAVRTYNVLITMAPASTIAKWQKRVPAPTLTIPGQLF